MTELIYSQTKKALAQEIRVSKAKIAELKNMIVEEEVSLSFMEEEYRELLPIIQKESQLELWEKVS